MSFIVTIILLGIGYQFSSSYVKRYKDSKFIKLYFYHIFFSMVYYWFVSSRSADANSYYKRAYRSIETFVEFGTGTQFMDFINTPIVQTFEMSKFNLFVLYGIISFWGCATFYLMIKKTQIINYKILGVHIGNIILFLPSMHFWTSGLGKDALVYTCVMVIFHGFSKIKKHLIAIIFCGILLSCIRPHVTLLITLSFIAIYALNSVTSFNIKSIAIVLGLMGVVVVLLPLFSNFVKLSEVSFEGVNNQFERFEGYGKRGIQARENTSMLDVSGYSLPYKIFSFLFRPLFYDARSIIQLISSFENSLLIFLLLNWFFRVKVIQYYRSLSIDYKAMFIYFLIGSFVFGMTMYNLGLAARQKHMIVPIMMLLFVLSPKKQQSDV